MKRIVLAAIISWNIFAADPADSQTNAPVVTSFNKASSVLGMAVKDPDGKNLGKIQELVLDLDSQKLAYAVVALQSDQGTRLVPVPMGALKAAKDHLLLNMSPAVLAAAGGIANDEWPAVDAFAVGGPAKVEKGQGSSLDPSK